MSTHIVNQTGPYSSATIGSSGVLSRVPYWAGINTPLGGTAIQVRLDSTDSLGSFTSQTSAILPGSATGSVQGAFDFEGAGVLYVDVFGATGPVYDLTYG